MATWPLFSCIRAVFSYFPNDHVTCAHWLCDQKPWMVYRALKLFSPSDPSDAVRLFPSSPDAEPLEKFGAQVSPLVCHPLGSLGVWSVNKEACWSAPASRVDRAEGCLTAFVGRCSWRKNLRMAPVISCIDLEKLRSGAFAVCWLHCGNRRSVFIERKEAEEMRVSQS